MAKTPEKYRGLPTAPSRVSAGLALYLNRLGKADAKKYENLRDFTRTHAIIWIDKRAKGGQSEVNLWLSRESEPISSGNARIRVQMRQLQNELAELSNRRDTSGRERKRTADRVARLNQEIMNFEAQHETNKERGFTLRRMAEEALMTWQTHRETMASVYTRARAIASGLDVSSVRAEIPEFEPVELVIIPELEEDLTQESPLTTRTTRRPSSAFDETGTTGRTRA